MNKVTSQKTRHVKRLTPMTRMGKATDKSLEEVAKAVLAPVFHRDGIPAQKVRCRPTRSNPLEKVFGCSCNRRQQHRRRVIAGAKRMTTEEIDG